jgi:hypothetical protein
LDTFFEKLQVPPPVLAADTKADLQLHQQHIYADKGVKRVAAALKAKHARLAEGFIALVQVTGLQGVAHACCMPHRTL